MKFIVRNYHSNFVSFKRQGNNMLQSFRNNYGLNSSISDLLCKHMGFHRSCNKFLIPDNYYLKDNMKRLLLNKQHLLSTSLKKEVEDNILKKIKLNTYQGNCIRNQLPSRGQRRRTNASTAKKLLGKMAFKAKKTIIR